MGRTACTEPQCLYLYLYLYFTDYERTLFFAAHRILAHLQRKLTLLSVQKPFSQRRFVALSFQNNLNYGNS
jgi:hypothetical protein